VRERFQRTRTRVLSAAVLTVTAAVALVGLSPKVAQTAWSAVKIVSANAGKATTDYWSAHKLSTATPLTMSTTPDEPSQPLDALTFQGVATVGALFFTDGTGLTSHYCSASVVHSATRDIVVTAAHCVYDASSGGYRYDIVFVPGYHAGEAPYGLWVPTRIVVDSQWTSSADPDHDVGFLVVARSGSSGGASTIEDVTGANRIGISTGYHNLVEVVGYPGDLEAPVKCWNYTTELSATQLSWACGGYPDGTSGGPFLTDVDSRTGTGVVVGVIGGYEQGGDTPDVSYSTYFGPSVQALYQEAVAAG
jgi:V8-like Glu-specific endopeptidase